MRAKRISEIGLDDINGLIACGTSESKSLEFKAEMYEQTESGRKQLCKHLSALANAAGGDLILGIREIKASEEQSRQLVLTPIIDEDFESVKQRIQQTIDAHIQPRLLLEYQPVYSDVVDKSKGYVLIIRVLQSIAGPHMWKFNQSTKFYTRTSHGVFPIDDVSELRQAFLTSESYEQRIREWRIDRLVKILSNEAPVPLVDQNCLVIHIISLPNFIRNDLSSINISERTHLSPFDLGMKFGDRINFEGRLLSSDGFIVPNTSYIQLFKCGVLEGVRCNVVTSYLENNTAVKFLKIDYIEQLLLEYYPQFVSALVGAGANYPILLYTSVLNTKDAYSAEIRGFPTAEHLPVRTNQLHLPTAVLEEPHSNIITILKSIVDPLWHAIGRQGSPNFDDNGNWISPRNRR